VTTGIPGGGREGNDHLLIAELSNFRQFPTPVLWLDAEIVGEYRRGAACWPR
jgi:hypothetical protein